MAQVPGIQGERITERDEGHLTLGGHTKKTLSYRPCSCQKRG